MTERVRKIRDIFTHLSDCSDEQVDECHQKIFNKLKENIPFSFKFKLRSHLTTKGMTYTLRPYLHTYGTNEYIKNFDEIYDRLTKYNKQNESKFVSDCINAMHEIKVMKIKGQKSFDSTKSANEFLAKHNLNS